MKPFSFYLNESFVAQAKYYLVSAFGETEYQAIVDAKPIAMIDGLMRLSITTKDKPKNTNPTSLEQTPSGWVSIYKKFD